MNARRHRLGVTALPLVAALVLAGCSSAAGGGTPAATGTAGAAAPGGQAGRGVKLGMVGLYNAPYPNAMAGGARIAAQEDGASFTQLGPQGLDPNQAVADFQNGVASGMKGILVMAYPGDLWTNPIDRAAAQGITVDTADDYADKSKAITEVGAGKVSMGAALAADYAKQLPKNATGVIIAGLCVAGLPALEAPLNGFRAEMERLRPGVTVPQPEVTAGDPTANFAAWQRIVAKYSTALGFVGACDQDLPNLIKVKESAPNSKILIGTTAGGDDPVAVKALEGGLVVGAVTQRSWVEGYVGMKLLANHILRKQPMPDGWINTGFDIVTKDNVRQIIKVLQDPKQAQQYYGALAQRLLKNAQTLAHHPMTYEYDIASIDAVNPQP